MVDTRISGLRSEPLWARVDANRVKLASFVALFVGGSATLLTLALVAVPGVLLGLGADFFGYADPVAWFARLPWVLLSVLGSMVAIGALLSAVQLSNAEDWVRNRFQGRPLEVGEGEALRRAVADMAIAAGLSDPPRLLVLEMDSINAFALGATRNSPIIGVTRGLLDGMTFEEQRAVVATLTARIIAGDIMFGTALAALMGPLKAVRGSRAALASGTGCALDGCANSGCVDVGDGCSGCGDAGGCVEGLFSDNDSPGGCLGAVLFALFLAVVAALTYAAVLSAAWIVTLWGRILHRTAYEKADAEGMLLLKDPGPMLSALSKAIRSSNAVPDPDPSYDGIFYASTSGTGRVERVERRRFDRLREVLGADGLVADLDDVVTPAGSGTDDA
jgi:Zn-dependent protease with chaperone function